MPRTRLGVFERAPMGFAQADDLGEPYAQRAAGGVVQGHGQVRTRLPQRRGAAAGGAPLWGDARRLSVRRGRRDTGRRAGASRRPATDGWRRSRWPARCRPGLVPAEQGLARSIRRARTRRAAVRRKVWNMRAIGGQRRHASQLSQREGVQVRVHVVRAPAHGGGQAAARGLRRLRDTPWCSNWWHGLGGAAGRQSLIGAASRAQQRAADVGQRVVVDIGAVAQFQRARLAVQPHDGFAGQAPGAMYRCRKRIVVHAAGSTQNLPRAAMQRVQADAEGFSPPRRQRQGVVAGHVVAQRFAGAARPLRDRQALAERGRALQRRSGAGQGAEDEKSAGADATVPMEITCYCDRAYARAREQ